MVEFCDANSPDFARQFDDMLRQVDERHLQLPAVVVDGTLAPVEWFSAWGLVELVEERLAALSEAVSG
jgi:hypothetical protein